MFGAGLYSFTLINNSVLIGHVEENRCRYLHSGELFLVSIKTQNGVLVSVPWRSIILFNKL